MSGTFTLTDQRRARRKRASTAVVVTNVINEQALGHLGNLSATGLMVISSEPPCLDAVYQVRFALPDSAPSLPPLELGIQTQWFEVAATPGQYWVGYRIIAINQAQTAAIEAWLG
ncbi:MAG: PilZ domain-containing protein [Dyella sp.]